MFSIKNKSGLMKVENKKNKVNKVKKIKTLKKTTKKKTLLEKSVEFFKKLFK